MLIYTNFCLIRVGNGQAICLWYVFWIGDLPFSFSFPRVFACDSCKVESMSSRLELGLHLSPLRMISKLGVKQHHWIQFLSPLQ